MSAAVAAPKAAQKQSNSPNQTLYITNINDKIPKPDLRTALYSLFVTYGPILDVVALKTMKMRGQAHIVFRDVQTSTQAMRALQDFDFFGKKMRISYGNGKSNTISMLDGSAKMPEAVKEQPAVSSDLQKSIFGAPPAAKSALPPASAGLPKLPAKPASDDVNSPAGTVAPQGQKRRRDDEDEADDVEMEEDDEDAAMDVSDEE